MQRVYERGKLFTKSKARRKIAQLEHHHTHFNDIGFGEFSVLDERVDDRGQLQRLLPRQNGYPLGRHGSGGNSQPDRC